MNKIERCYYISRNAIRNYFKNPSKSSNIINQTWSKIEVNYKLAYSSEEGIYNNLFINNNDYKSIKPIIHERINLFNFKTNNNNVNKEDKNSIVCSIVSRHG